MTIFARISGKAFLAAALLLSWCLHGMASQPVDDFVASPTTDASSVSVYVYDLGRKRQTEGYNESVPLIPASITKALTVASCQLKTGIDYCYETHVYTDGSLKNGILHGNLIIVGSGDPSLNSRQDAGSDFVSEVVGALKRKKITRIDGQILFDQSIFPLPAHPASWPAGDKSQSYGAGCFGFNFENNASGKSSVANPAAVCDTRLRKAFEAHGITLGDAVVAQTRRSLLVEHRSLTIDDLMRSCIRRSDNMYAEAFLRTYALRCKREATPDAGAAAEMEMWRRKGVDMKGVKIVDGSGLSRQNRMTAKFLGEVLERMADDVDYVSYFPLAGQEGTLSSFLKDTRLDSFIALKTGSMNGIQCYAGYKLDYNFAPTHVVVIMVNNLTARGALRAAVEKMLLGLFPDEN